MTEQVNWDEVTPGYTENQKVTGGIYRGEGAQRVTAWSCPACNAKNVSIFEEGCPACGAGKPGKFVGVDPIVRKAPTPELAAEEVVRALAAEARVQEPSSRMEDAFLEFTQTLGHVSDVKLLWAAFTAGAKWGSRNLVRKEQPMADPSVASPTLPGTKQTRTLAAALRFFKEQILSNSPEEITSGEWCTPEEVDSLINYFEGRP